MRINVDKMKEKFSEMKCILAEPGNYKNTVSKIDNELKKNCLGGFRKMKSRKLNIKIKKSKFRFSK